MNVFEKFLILIVFVFFVGSKMVFLFNYVEVIMGLLDEVGKIVGVVVVVEVVEKVDLDVGLLIKVVVVVVGFKGVGVLEEMLEKKDEVKVEGVEVVLEDGVVL